MGKHPNLIDGPYVSPNIDHDKDMEEHGANPLLTKLVYVALVILAVVLFLFLGPGLHKPTGG
jgi:hypothetical protein